MSCPDRAVSRGDLHTTPVRLTWNGHPRLTAFTGVVHEDGVRDLMRHGRETAQLRIFESKKAYLAHVRKFFDVGANAFTLLNRAAGLKQLNSIDEIFRDLVLEDRDRPKGPRTSNVSQTKSQFGIWVFQTPNL